MNNENFPRGGKIYASANETHEINFRWPNSNYI